MSKHEPIELELKVVGIARMKNGVTLTSERVVSPFHQDKTVCDYLHEASTEVKDLAMELADELFIDPKHYDFRDLHRKEPSTDD